MFQMTNVAAAIADIAPSITDIILTTTAQSAAMAAIEVQGDLRTDDFLTQLNLKYLRPWGLFCLILEYDPDNDMTYEAVDISTSILTRVDPSSRKQRTMGEVTMPQAAPLIIHVLDALHRFEVPK